MRRLVVLLALALATCGDLEACAPGWNDPAPPTADYPCGPAGVECPTLHTCCGANEICGGEPGAVGCPAGSCCFIGDVGARRRPQRPR